MSCDFCKIIEESKNRIYTDDLVSVILDIDPITKGHVLILPKKHYLDIDELPERTLMRIFKISQMYVKLLKKEYNPAGYSIMQNGGEFNDISHFHLHVFARFSDKDFGYSYNDNVDEEAKNFETLKKIFGDRLAEEMDKV